MYITPRPENIMVRGEGSWLWDNQGKKYLDFIQGWAVNSLGHCHPKMVETLSNQSHNLLNPSPAFFNQPSIDLAKLICDLSCFDKVFFSNSGAEANEGAIKLARKWGALHKENAFEIITFHHGFHGRTLATMSASGKEGWDQLFEPKVDGFKKATFNDIDSVKPLISNQTVAIMLEPIQGEAGVIPATDNFIKDLKKLCQENNILLIFDEVQTGTGRTGKTFAYEHFNVEPDIMTLGKGLGGGIPISALVAKGHICCFEPGDQGGTYNGNPLVCAVAKVVLEEVSKKSFQNQVNEISSYIKNKLDTVKEKYAIHNIRGKGLLLAFDFQEINSKDVVNSCFEKGLLLNGPREKSIRLVPALNVNQTEVDEMFEILFRVLDQFKAN